MKCEVLDVMHVEGMEADYLVYLKVLDYKQDDNKAFLASGEVK